MKRIKVLLGPLLPALWLLASSVCCFDVPLDDPQDDGLVSLPAARQNGRLPARRHSGSFQLSAAAGIGHFWIGAGCDEPPGILSAVESTLPAAARCSPEARPAGVCAAEELAHSWQFLCRAAPPARAPSLLS